MSDLAEWQTKKVSARRFNFPLKRDAIMFGTGWLAICATHTHIHTLESLISLLRCLLYRLCSAASEDHSTLYENRHTHIHIHFKNIFLIILCNARQNKTNDHNNYNKTNPWLCWVYIITWSAKTHAVKGCYDPDYVCDGTATLWLVVPSKRTTDRTNQCAKQTDSYAHL